MKENIRVSIGKAQFEGVLEESPAARQFRNMLPNQFEMLELNNNEKYAALKSGLKASPSRPGKIQAGDTMLWGDETVVLFYKSFSTSYSYTRLGRITDTNGLEAAVGKGNVTVKMEPA